jgi:transglutaminase-like putative cysteine protease
MAIGAQIRRRYLAGFGWLPVDPSRDEKKSEAARGDAFHHLTPDFLVTTQGSGGSRHLHWTYSHHTAWTCQGRCLVKTEAIAEWSPRKKP